MLRRCSPVEILRWQTSEQIVIKLFLPLALVSGSEARNVPFVENRASAQPIEDLTEAVGLHSDQSFVLCENFLAESAGTGAVSLFSSSRSVPAWNHCSIRAG